MYGISNTGFVENIYLYNHHKYYIECPQIWWGQFLMWLCCIMNYLVHSLHSFFSWILHMITNQALCLSRLSVLKYNVHVFASACMQKRWSSLLHTCWSYISFVPTHHLNSAIWWQIWIHIGSGNGLLPDVTKPLPELRAISQGLMSF